MSPKGRPEGEQAPERISAEDRAPRAATQAAHRAIDAVWRIESARIIAGVAGGRPNLAVFQSDAIAAFLEGQARRLPYYGFVLRSPSLIQYGTQSLNGVTPRAMVYYYRPGAAALTRARSLASASALWVAMATCTAMRPARPTRSLLGERRTTLRSRSMASSASPRAR